MPNKIVKIPVSEVDGLLSTGGYSLRYRVKSKDGSRKSDWSEISNIYYQTDIANGKIYSFYERMGFGRPRLAYYNLSNPSDVNNNTDPHDLPTSSAYNLASVFEFLTNQYVTSSISISEDTEGLLTYTWDSLETYPVNQKFDVYLSFRDSANGWSGWSFAGTTLANTFSFTSPYQGQYVQAAVFLSSYPKLDNIFQQETNFVSISSQFNVYRDAGASNLATRVAAPTGGKATAQITGLAETFPTSGYSGRRVYADTSATSGDRAAFGEAKVVVRRRLSNTSIEVESNVDFAADITIYNLSLV